MIELTISVTQAARKFADYINRVHYQGASFLLQKNGVPVARIVPVQSSFGTDFEQLAVSLRQARREPIAADQPLQSPIAAGREELPPTIEASRPVKRPTLNW